jgi:hypothetical protein
MKKLSLLLLTISFFALSAVAQSIVLCEDYNKTTGEATGVYKTWDIKSDGGFIYVVYNQPRKISSGSWYLYIDKDWDDNGKYSAFETIELDEDVSKTWLMYDFKFTEKGKYKVDIMKDGVSQATTYTTIQFADGEEGKSTSEDEDEEVDTYYYENSEIIFCESVSADGDPESEATTFKANREGTREVTIYLSNDKAFKTTKMYVDIYDSKSNEKIDDFTIDVEVDWDWVKFKQTFTKPGEYYIDIYNEDDTFINTATVTITK